MTPEQAELERIYEAIESQFGYTRMAMQSKDRGDKILAAVRRAAYVVIRQRLGWGSKRIACEFNKTPTAIAHLLNKTGRTHCVSDDTIKFRKAIENRLQAALRQ